ncbi:phosphonate ABC transporter, permease protein PhnE [Desulfobacula phenolica]|uniref:Phosphonate transport system permease protein n=1 Tax=Desulfobacula phenolica TaxID=90732 RepID=A0A1H2ECT9_9BACT|nr:phosphonate ABC transporter, permease protein PhnE [Desulfobacula phenolica]SDT92834.1 phosphonate transport system permease protein [Desulfobacula phenolica]
MNAIKDDDLPNGTNVTLTLSRLYYIQFFVRFGTFLFLLVFIGYSLFFMDVKLNRCTSMFGNIGNMIKTRFYPPDIHYILNERYLKSVFETIQMAYLGALSGILCSIPISWCASFNVTPNKRFAYPAGKFIITFCRSIHEMIWGLFFVITIGYGMFSGVLALTMWSIGFVGKLFSDEIESINMGQVEAIRATGGNSIQVFIYAVFPQVRVAWIGISIYSWDSAFRAATVLGYFGAGGMGLYLKQTVEELEYFKVSAILLTIIMLVLISEIVSAWVRHRIKGQL